MAIPADSATPLDYTPDLAALIAAVTRIAVATERIADEIGVGAPAGGLGRAMMVNALRDGGQLEAVVAEIQNPTVLPTGPK